MEGHNVEQKVRAYCCVDLKSYYASCEAVDRRLDPLTTNLVVADASRTDSTICLAVSPSLKALGIPGRPRLFEVKQKVEQINAERLRTAVRCGKNGVKDGKPCLMGESFDADALAADPALALSFITATPRMARYMEVSSKIYAIYLRFLSEKDIHVYSIDEIFADLTPYLETYHMTARELVKTMIREVLYETGITATAGIGTNLYLSKVALDISAKQVPADADGVRIAELDETSFRYLLWDHRPLTDFWRIGPGTAARLENEESLRKHPRMSLENRAKIFSPFAALRGYEQEIAREDRNMRRVERPTPSEGEVEKLSAKLAQVLKGMEVCVLYFQEDTSDPSGRHMGWDRETSGRVEVVDPVGQTIRVNGQVIPFADIQDIAGSMIPSEESRGDTF